MVALSPFPSVGILVSHMALIPSALTLRSVAEVMACTGVISTRISGSKDYCSANVRQKAPVHLSVGYNVAEKSSSKTRPESDNWSPPTAHRTHRQFHLNYQSAFH